jgi:hypothetical protein
MAETDRMQKHMDTNRPLKFNIVTQNETKKNIIKIIHKEKNV